MEQSGLERNKMALEDRLGCYLTGEVVCARQLKWKKASEDHLASCGRLQCPNRMSRFYFSGVVGS